MKKVLSFRTILSLSCLFASLLPLRPALAQSVSTDINGDTLSDLVLISINSDATLQWQAYNPVTSLASGDPFSLAKSGDHIGIANWTSKDNAQYAFLTKNSKGGVTWRIRRDTGSIKSFNFGKSSDVFISGADFDGNGYSDAALVRTNSDTGKLDWYIKYNPLAPAAIRARNKDSRGRALLTKFSLGEPGDKIFFARRDKTHDWAGVMSASGSSSKFTYYSPASRRTRKLTFPVVAGSVLRPLNIRQPKNLDLLTLATRNTADTTVTVIDLTGALISQSTLPGTGELLTGNFSADVGMPGEELAIQTTSGFTFFNPKSGQTQALALTSGIPIDQVNINSFSADSGGGENGGGGTCTTETRNPRDGADGFLWKPVGNNGKLVVIIPTSFNHKVAKLEVQSADGTVLEKGTFSGIGNGERSHFRFGKAGGKYPSPAKIVATLIAGCTTTWEISNTNSRID